MYSCNTIQSKDVGAFWKAAVGSFPKRVIRQQCERQRNCTELKLRLKTVFLHFFDVPVDINEWVCWWNFFTLQSFGCSYCLSGLCLFLNCGDVCFVFFLISTRRYLLTRLLSQRGSSGSDFSVQRFDGSAHLQEVPCINARHREKVQIRLEIPVVPRPHNQF